MRGEVGRAESIMGNLDVQPIEGGLWTSGLWALCLHTINDDTIALKVGGSGRCASTGSSAERVCAVMV